MRTFNKIALFLLVTTMLLEPATGIIIRVVEKAGKIVAAPAIKECQVTKPSNNDQLQAKPADVFQPGIR